MKNPTRQELEQVFKGLADEELLARCESGTLTDEARPIAFHEARSRGLNPVEPSPPPPAEPAQKYYGDFVVVVRDLNMVQANVYKMLLEAAGIPSEVGDANFSRAYGTMYAANVKVPEAFVREAAQIFAAYQRGEFAIGDDFDPDAG